MTLLLGMEFVFLRGIPECPSVWQTQIRQMRRECRKRKFSAGPVFTDSVEDALSVLGRRHSELLLEYPG